MRRRSKRPPNTSESTGKIGQELPSSGLAPLRPAYPESVTSAAGTPAQAATPATSSLPESVELTGELHGLPPAAEDESSPARAVGSAAEPPSEALDAANPKVEVETQPDSVGTPPAEPMAVPPRSPRGYVVLTIGLPGSGKTTWYKRRGVAPLSSEMLRTILFDDITDQRYQGLVFSTLRSLLRARLIAKMPWNYVDATNLSPHERRQWIKMAKSFGYEVQAVFFDVPLSVCLERNSKRERQVTDEMMQKMAERLRPPAFREGFDKITVVRVKGAAPMGTEALPSAMPEPGSPEADQAALAGPEHGAENSPEAAVEG